MRYELTDYEWRVIRPMLPNKPRGVPRVDDRRVLNGTLWILSSGAPWRDVPESFGPLEMAPASRAESASPAAAQETSAHTAVWTVAGVSPAAP
jgi:transposase